MRLDLARKTVLKTKVEMRMNLSRMTNIVPSIILGKNISVVPIFIHIRIVWWRGLSASNRPKKRGTINIEADWQRFKRIPCFQVKNAFISKFPLNIIDWSIFSDISLPKTALLWILSTSGISVFLDLLHLYVIILKICNCTLWKLWIKQLIIITLICKDIKSLTLFGPSVRS